MRRHEAILIPLCVVFAVISTACGPKCPEVKTAMSEKEIADDDANRVNNLVSKRKNLMGRAQEQQLSSFEVERLRFSVTAYEMAIQIQLRIIQLRASSDLYQQNLEEINETRCMLDSILKNKLLKPDDHTLSDTVGKRIHKKHTLFRELFDKEGEVPVHDLDFYYENGLGKDQAMPKTTLISEDPAMEEPQFSTKKDSKKGASKKKASKKRASKKKASKKAASKKKASKKKASKKAAPETKSSKPAPNKDKSE